MEMYEQDALNQDPEYQKIVNQSKLQNNLGVQGFSRQDRDMGIKNQLNWKNPNHRGIYKLIKCLIRTADVDHLVKKCTTFVV